MNQPVESEMLILERIFKVVDEFGVAGQYKDEELWLDTTEGNRQIFERKPGGLAQGLRCSRVSRADSLQSRPLGREAGGALSTGLDARGAGMKYEYWPPEGEDQPEHPNPSLVFISLRLREAQAEAEASPRKAARP